MIELINKKGCSVWLNEIGAAVVSVIVPDRYGNLDDVVIGYRDVESYRNDGPCAGKIPGRFANRIALAQFSIDDETFHLDQNKGRHHLHGGSDGFANRTWKVLRSSATSVCFHLSSPHMDQGYPGNMEVDASYSWDDENTLKLEISAVSDRDTIVNLTNHTYWNLSGENSGSVLDHELQVNAGEWLVTDSDLIPTGEIASVERTPMDFRVAKKIGRDIHADFEALRFGKGYDNCWVLKGSGMRQAAILSDAASGRRLEVYTTQPALQVYTGNWLHPSPISKSGRSYNDYDAVALECQGFPDAPHHPDFPSAMLRKGEKYHQIIEFRLKTE